MGSKFKFKINKVNVRMEVPLAVNHQKRRQDIKHSCKQTSLPEKAKIKLIKITQRLLKMLAIQVRTPRWLIKLNKFKKERILK